MFPFQTVFQISSALFAPILSLAALVSAAVLPTAALESEPQLCAPRISLCWSSSATPQPQLFCATEKEITDSCCWCLDTRNPKWCKEHFLTDSVFTSKKPTHGQYRIIPTAIQQQQDEDYSSRQLLTDHGPAHSSISSIHCWANAQVPVQHWCQRCDFALYCRLLTHIPPGYQNTADSLHLI